MFAWLFGTTIPPKPDVKRSPHWPAFRAAHIAKTCAATGRTDMLELHHIEPFHDHPKRELDPDNVITLTEASAINAHYFVGHLLDWKSHNPNVREDAATWLKKITGRITE